MSRGASLFALLAAAAWLGAGCLDGETLLPPSGPPGPMRIGVGWWSDDDPAETGAQAIDSALAQVGDSRPQLILVLDNFDSPAARTAPGVLSAVARRVPDRLIFGGHVAWPAGPGWTTVPSACVVVFAGDWRMDHVAYDQAVGRERQIGAALARWLAAPPAGQAGPADEGSVVLLFGDFSAPRAQRLVEGLSEHSGGALSTAAGRPGPLIVGGSGGGRGQPGGGGWQYVAGRLVRDHLFAVRLRGRFLARGVLVSAEPDSESIRSSAATAAAVVAQQLARSRPAGEPPPWRALLVCPSAGWLAYDRRPDRIIRNAADRFGVPTSQPSGDAAPREGDRAVEIAMIGWAGDAQVGPRAGDGALAAEPFGASLAVIEPLPPPPTTQPD